MNKRVKYSHPSVLPEGINLNEIYDLTELAKRADFEDIKTFFEPVIELEVKEIEVQEVVSKRK